MKINTRKLAVLGMCCAAAMILSYVESFVSFGVPGLKAGLPNIMIVFLLYTYGWREAGAVSLTRVVLVSLLFGNVMTLWYSLAGAICSLALMAVLKKVNFFSNIGVSIAGAITHNAAQIGVAIIVMGTKEIAAYMPLLAISGTLAGVIIGIIGGRLCCRASAISGSKK